MSSETAPSFQFVSPTAVLEKFSALDEIGRSAANRPIFGKRISGSGKRTLFIGGVHGNETEGVAATLGFFEEFIARNQPPPTANEIYFIPVLSPDGFANFSRHNGNGVDLNRNMATDDWKANAVGEKYYSGPTPNSEPETKLLLQILNEFKPDFILSLHSWKPMFNVNGPAHEYAKHMHAQLDYEITEDIGYPTPGSLGTYAGWERKIPTITFEIERGIELEKVYPKVRNAILAVL